MLFQSWKPWLLMLRPFTPPADLYHVTLFYIQDENEVYRDAFENELEGTFLSIVSPCLFVGPEGVAAQVVLTDKQMEWDEMA